MCRSPSAKAGAAANSNTAAEAANVSFFGIVSLPLFALARDQIRYRDESDRDHQQNGRDRIDFRRQRQPDLAPDVERQRRLPRTCDELGDGEIVERGDESESRS